MFDFFFKHGSRDEQLANKASGDIDMIISPRDGALVVVGQEGGVHVCYCKEPFVDDPGSPLRPIEYTPQDLSDDGQNFGTRILIHAKCAKVARQSKSNIIHDLVRGHQARRFLTKALKPFAGDPPTLGDGGSATPPKDGDKG